MQDPQEVARLFAHFFSNVLGILLALLGIAVAASPNAPMLKMLAGLIAVVAGGPLLLLLLGTSIHLHRKGVGRPFQVNVWSKVLAGAAILPLCTLVQQIRLAF